MLSSNPLAAVILTAEEIQKMASTNLHVEIRAYETTRNGLRFTVNVRFPMRVHSASYSYKTLKKAVVGAAQILTRNLEHVYTSIGLSNPETLDFGSMWWCGNYRRVDRMGIKEFLADPEIVLRITHQQWRLAKGIKG